MFTGMLHVQLRGGCSALVLAARRKRHDRSSSSARQRRI